MIQTGALKIPKIMVCKMSEEHDQAELIEMLTRWNSIKGKIKMIKVFNSRKVKDRFNTIVKR